MKEQKTIENTEKYRLGSLERVLDVIECFTYERQKLSLAEITRLTGQNHTSLKRILFTLTDRNYLSQDKETKKYRFGIKFFEIGGLIYASMSLRKAAASHLAKLRDDTGFTVLLGIMMEEQLIYVDKREGRNVLRVSPRIGSRRPPHFGILGRVLMAYMPPEKIDRLLTKYPLEQYTEKSITNIREFYKRLSEIRQNGFVFEREEIHQGTMGFAAPIWRADNTLAGAVGIAMPVILVNDEREEQTIANKLCQTAIAISKEIGYTVDQ
ncbi:MAG: IclR family transcriptional regulator [Desulfobacterales bacterium]|jgi:DNA-binding IclR family transcriptional regulator